jgi:hypothetical protein
MEFNPGAFRDVARATVSQATQPATGQVQRNAQGRISEHDYRAIAAQYAAAARNIGPQQMEAAKALLRPWIQKNLAKNDDEGVAAQLVDAVFRDQSFEEYQNGLSRPSKRVERVKDEKKDKQK